MTPAAPTAPATTDQNADHLLREIEAAWVAEEFDAIIAANWPTEPPEPPRSQGPPIQSQPARGVWLGSRHGYGSPIRGPVLRWAPGNVRHPERPVTDSATHRSRSPTRIGEMEQRSSRN